MYICLYFTVYDRPNRPIIIKIITIIIIMVDFIYMVRRALHSSRITQTNVHHSERFLLK